MKGTTFFTGFFNYICVKLIVKIFIYFIIKTKHFPQISHLKNFPMKNLLLFSLLFAVTSNLFSQAPKYIHDFKYKKTRRNTKYYEVLGRGTIIQIVMPDKRNLFFLGENKEDTMAVWLKPEEGEREIVGTGYKIKPSGPIFFVVRGFWKQGRHQYTFSTGSWNFDDIPEPGWSVGNREFD